MCFALKENQRSLYTDVKAYFEEKEKSGFKKSTCTLFKTLEKNHGRIEKRTLIAIDALLWLRKNYEWKALKSIYMVISEREIQGEKTFEKRYYITSLSSDAEKLEKLLDRIGVLKIVFIGD